MQVLKRQVTLRAGLQEGRSSTGPNSTSAAGSSSFIRRMPQHRGSVAELSVAGRVGSMVRLLDAPSSNNNLAMGGSFGMLQTRGRNSFSSEVLDLDSRHESGTATARALHHSGGHADGRYNASPSQTPHAISTGQLQLPAAPLHKINVSPVSPIRGCRSPASPMNTSSITNAQASCSGRANTTCSGSAFPQPASPLLTHGATTGSAGKSFRLSRGTLNETANTSITVPNGATHSSASDSLPVFVLPGIQEDEESAVNGPSALQLASTAPAVAQADASSQPLPLPLSSPHPARNSTGTNLPVTVLLASASEASPGLTPACASGSGPFYRSSGVHLGTMAGFGSTFRPSAHEDGMASAMASSTAQLHGVLVGASGTAVGANSIEVSSASRRGSSQDDAVHAPLVLYPHAHGHGTHSSPVRASAAVHQHRRPLGTSTSSHAHSPQAATTARGGATSGRTSAAASPTGSASRLLQLTGSDAPTQSLSRSLPSSSMGQSDALAVTSALHSMAGRGSGQHVPGPWMLARTASFSHGANRLLTQSRLSAGPSMLSRPCSAAQQGSMSGELSTSTTGGPGIATPPTADSAVGAGDTRAAHSVSQLGLLISSSDGVVGLTGQHSASQGQGMSSSMRRALSLLRVRLYVWCGGCHAYGMMAAVAVSYAWPYLPRSHVCSLGARREPSPLMASATQAVCTYSRSSTDGRYSAIPMNALNLAYQKGR